MVSLARSAASSISRLIVVVAPEATVPSSQGDPGAGASRQPTVVKFSPSKPERKPGQRPLHRRGQGS